MNEIVYMGSRLPLSSVLQILIGIPILSGILIFIVPEKLRTIKGIFAVLISIFTGYLTIRLFGTDFQAGVVGNFPDHAGFALFGVDLLKASAKYNIFNFDNLSRLIVMFISIFTFLILLYSLIYINKGRAKHYYEYFLVTAGCAYGAALADNLLLFIFFWGMLGITLYKLIPGTTEESSATAKKTLILVGASDSIMLIGIALIWRLTDSLSISSVSLATDNILTIIAFLALLVGSFTKAGAFPFHTWVPDYAKNAPATSSALLPASLDKLLGIYFLARLTTNIFTLNDGMRLLLLSVGVITIISAVMMALVQHNFKRLLGFHAVSQVGYMILGFGLGSLIGVAAGLFHMINHALYKSGLLLTAGCVEYRTGEEDLDELGGLSKAMPITFFAALIFAMSISGVPPLNGFASKWMIYQGIIDFGIGPGVANKLWVLWLGLAVFGSALTLASFIKFIGGIFLSRRKPSLEHVREVPILMWIPLVVLALFCITFGVFATNLVVPKLLMPVSGEFRFTGFWNSGFVSLLVVVSIVLGIIIYLSTSLKKFRSEDSFIGGERIQDETSYPTPEFYKTIAEIGFFSWMYKKAEKKWFDVYDLSKQFVLWVSHGLSEAHTGLLPAYVLWIFAGLVVMLLIMI
ncbi:MAG: proton-conducting transporter membrane subunit [Bacteroidota bacterium]|nr:proton-conducting transporter membrane subunit [Bacteroidota bacterium]